MIWNEMALPPKGQVLLKLANSTSYGNWSWAKDSDGRAGIALEVSIDTEVAINSLSKYFEIRSQKMPLIGNVLTIYCTDSEFFEIFYILCKDLLKFSFKANSVNEALDLLSDRLEIWSKLFSRGFKGLSIQQIMGLIAELLFLKKILIKSISPNINIWTGPKGSPQDFIDKKSNVAVEVKAVSKDNSLVKISSIDQLDFNGELYLVTIPINSAKIDDQIKINLDFIVKEICELIDAVQMPDFQKLLLNSGYVENLYKDYFFVLDEPTYYKVNLNFPKIIRSMVSTEIISAKYEIKLKDISEFKVNFQDIEISTYD
jgi:hypothetical protein